MRQVPLFTSGGLGLKNLVLFTSLLSKLGLLFRAEKNNARLDPESVRDPNALHALHYISFSARKGILFSNNLRLVSCPKLTGKTLPIKRSTSDYRSRFVYLLR